MSQRPGCRLAEVCLLSVSNNFPVSFIGLNTASDELQAFHASGQAVAEVLRVLHWPGRPWKPWLRPEMGRSVAEELWWAVAAAAKRCRELGVEGLAQSAARSLSPQPTAT